MPFWIVRWAVKTDSSKEARHDNMKGSCVGAVSLVFGEAIEAFLGMSKCSGADNSA